MNDIPRLIFMLKDFLNNLAPFIVGLTLLYFIFGVFRLVQSGNETAREQGRSIIGFGIVGLFIMVSVWGLVNIISNSVGFGPDASRAPQGPGVPQFR